MSKVKNSVLQFIFRAKERQGPLREQPTASQEHGESQALVW